MSCILTCKNWYDIILSVIKLHLKYNSVFLLSQKLNNAGMWFFKVKTLKFNREFGEIPKQLPLLYLMNGET